VDLRNEEMVARAAPTAASEQLTGIWVEMASGRRPLIAANWKMNGLRADGLALARAVAARATAFGAGLPGEVLICPPATLVDAVGGALEGSPVLLGGQDCHARPSGAFTGDIAAPMLKDLGASHVILGHSERRALHGEGDQEVRAKAEAALAAGLIAIVCVGETEAQRDGGDTLAVIVAQIDGSIPANATSGSLVVAYEPVWAIGTGRTPTLPEIAEVHHAIRERLAARIVGGGDVRILYGGSVKPSNAAEVLALADVDGALVGGASLKADDFWAIVTALPQA
jgi:triosephosphate isomerase